MVVVVGREERSGTDRATLVVRAQCVASSGAPSRVRELAGSTGMCSADMKHRRGESGRLVGRILARARRGEKCDVESRMEMGEKRTGGNG